jgi:hypothetical protein
MPRCYLVKKAKQFGMRDWSNLGHNVHCEGTPTYSPLDYQEPSQSLPRPSGTGLIVFNVIFISYSNVLRGILLLPAPKGGIDLTSRRISYVEFIKQQI